MLCSCLFTLMFLPQVSGTEEGTVGWGVWNKMDTWGVILSGSGCLVAYISKTVNNAMSQALGETTSRNIEAVVL